MGEKMSLEQVKAEMWEHMGHGFPRAEDDDMQRWIDAIDAHLTQPAQSVAAKDAEIERLSQESAQQFIRARDWAELSGKNEDRASLAESRLAAANELLGKVYAYLDRFDPNSEVYDDVESYLQGTGAGDRGGQQTGGESSMSVEIDKSLRETPNPGSDAAIAAGCTCPVMDNGRGRGAYGTTGLFWYSGNCPVHAKREAGE